MMTYRQIRRVIRKWKMKLRRHRILTRSGGKDPSRRKTSGCAKRLLGRLLKRLASRRIYQSPFPGATWIVIGLLGTTVGLTCLALSILTGPGPALVIAPVGLLVFAAQLMWAKNFLQSLCQTQGGWIP
jgi:hypothetical protein